MDSHGLFLAYAAGPWWVRCGSPWWWSGTRPTEQPLFGTLVVDSEVKTSWWSAYGLLKLQLGNHRLWLTSKEQKVCSFLGAGGGAGAGGLACRKGQQVFWKRMQFITVMGQKPSENCRTPGNATCSWPAPGLPANQLRLQFRWFNTQPTVLFSGMIPPSRPFLFTTPQNIDFKIVNQQSPFPDRRAIFLRRNSHFLKVVLNSSCSFQLDWSFCAACSKAWPRVS